MSVYSVHDGDGMDGMEIAWTESMTSCSGDFVAGFAVTPSSQCTSSRGMHIGIILRQCAGCSCAFCFLG